MFFLFHIFINNIDYYITVIIYKTCKYIEFNLKMILSSDYAYRGLSENNNMKCE